MQNENTEVERRHFTILLAGDLTASDRLCAQLEGSRFLAADAGLTHSIDLNVPVELWLGDFDSCDPALLEQHAHIPREAYPEDKDATDGELAIAAAIERGATSLILAGGLGGQADHTLQHFTQIIDLANRGIPAFMTSGDEEAWPLIPGQHLIDLPTGSRVSVIAFDDLAGFTLQGVKWPLDDRDVPFGSSLTLSNVATGPVTVRLKQGYGIIIAYPHLGE